MGCHLLLLLLAASGAYAQEWEIPNYDWDDWTLLDDYVWNDDGAYSWTLLDTYYYEGVHVHMINMTSQYYLEEDMTSQHLWWHTMGCAFPDQVNIDDGGFMFLVGGNNRNPDEWPAEDDLEPQAAAGLANMTGIAGCFLGQVINGPITFYNDPELRGLSGDSQIAWTFRSFIDNPEWSGPQILSRFSMTKSSKAGLDTMLTVAEELEGMQMDNIMLTGPSKWGWTTWSHFAVDPRIDAITPIVFSLMNIGQTMMDHYMALEGAWSFALEPYYNENLTQILTTDEGRTLVPFEDMYCYRSRYEGRPVLAISATGDEYFFPQDFHNWWDDFPEPKWLMMVPNAEHLLFPHYADIFGNINAFWNAVLGGNVNQIPTVEWTRRADPINGTIEMHLSKEPDSYRAMRAVTLQNDTMRDFRLISGYPDQSLHPVWWRRNLQGIDVSPDGKHISHTTTSFPDEWVGHLIEVTYEWDDVDTPFIFTSEVNIIQDSFPADPCTSSAECYSHMV